MTTFINTKLKKSDDQTNIDKYRLAAIITEYYIISKLHLYKIHDYKLGNKLICLNGRRDFLVRIIELLHFLHST